MKRLSLSVFALFLMLTMVGCGGSSVSLPESAMTKDLYAVQWYDTKNMSAEDTMKMLSNVADDMSDDQPKARLWMSSRADRVEERQSERWEDFTEAGGQGFLVLHYEMEVTEGEGDNATTRADYKTFVLVRVKKGTSTDELEEAVADFAKADGNEKIKFVKVEGEDNWFYLTREGEDTPDLPDDGDKDVAKAFEKMLRSAGNATAVMAWTMPEKVKEEVEQELKRENLTDDEKARLKEQLHTESVVMSVTTGGSPNVEVTINFDEKEQAESFAEEHNDGLVKNRRELKEAMVNAENPPHPSVINRLVENMEVNASGKRVSLTMGSGEVRDVLSLMAAMQGADISSPNRLLRINTRLKVPNLGAVSEVGDISFSDRR